MTSAVDMTKVIVIRRRLRNRSVHEITKEVIGKIEPFYESEKPRNPLEFVKTSYGKLLQSIPLWINLHIPEEHLFELFGEPTRFVGNSIEWAIKLPTKEVIKIVLKNRRTLVYGFTRNKNIEKWVNRLLSS